MNQLHLSGKSKGGAYRIDPLKHTDTDEEGSKIHQSFLDGLIGVINRCAAYHGLASDGTASTRLAARRWLAVSTGLLRTLMTYSIDLFFPLAFP
jgi:hypothetical protein